MAWEKGVTVRDFDGDSHEAILDKHPNFCPVCNHPTRPKYHGGSSSKGHTRVTAIFQCTLEQCEELFLGSYASVVNMQNYFTLSGCKPKTHQVYKAPSLVKTASPSFENLYNQSWHAQQEGLEDIAGPGFRKALEFLVKDLLILRADGESNKEDLVAAIKREMLGSLLTHTIKKTENKILIPFLQSNFNNANITKIAERATWLGNDETHYERRWQDQDIESLKRAIQLTANWINHELESQELLNQMP